LSFIYTKPNEFYCRRRLLFSVAELLVRPTHQELEFLIGKVDYRHTEFLFMIAIVGIPCDDKKNVT